VLYRVNVIFAALTMNADLGFSPLVYTWGAGIFFIGYFILEIPSNLALHRFGPRRRIARIMIVWGVVSARLAFVTGPNSFLAAVSDSRPRSKNGRSATAGSTASGKAGSRMSCRVPTRPAIRAAATAATATPIRQAIV
jgi:MFS family permease